MKKRSLRVDADRAALLGILAMVSYGSVPQNRTKQLLKALLDFVNYDLPCDNIRLEWRWEDEDSDRPRLVVTTTLEDLRELIQNDSEDRLKTDDIRHCLNRYMRKYLGILQDHRTKRTSPEWRFTLQLWSRRTADNLKQFDEEWTRRHPNPQTSQSSDEEEELDSRSQPSPSRRTPQNLPHSGVRKFVGRDETLDRLHQQLQQNDRVAISAVTGMGGIGKTELALQYARRYRQEYQGGICWLSARDADVGLAIVNFARVHFNVNPPDDLPLKDRVRYCWHHWPIEGEILTILDDVTDYKRVKPFLPPDDPRFKVIITTRSQRLSHAFENLHLKVLTKEAALELLQSLIGECRIEKELEATEKLCQWLGYLPLGLELVGQYLAEREDLSLTEMRARLEKKGLEQKALVEHTTEATAERGVKAAFELSWQDLPENAREVAYVLSLFAVTPIPWGVVKEYFECDKEELEDIRDRILVKFSLLQKLTKDFYHLHPLLREFIQDKLEEFQYAEILKKKYCRVMVQISQQIPARPTLEDIERVTPIVPSLEGVIEQLCDCMEDEDLVELLAGLGQYYEGQGLYDRAESWYEECLQVSRDRLGQENLSVASSLNNLAALYYAQERYEKAETFYNKALELSKKLFGKEHPYVAQLHNNLAVLYYAQGRYKEAKPLYNKVLELSRELLREEYPRVANSLNNLAAFYYAQGRYKEAESLYEKTLELGKKLVKEKNISVAKIRNNLANFHYTQGYYEEAESLYNQVLKLSKKLLGEEHPYMATYFNTLVQLYKSQGRNEKAKSLYKQAQNLSENILREEHPYVVTCLNNLSEFYYTQGCYEEAESLYNQALKLSKKLLGEEHPYMATYFNTLAQLYESQGRNEEAQDFYLQALAQYRKFLEYDHPST